MDILNCTVCGIVIGQDRREQWPRVRTCSRECSAELDRRNRADAQKRYRRRHKETRA